MLESNPPRNSQLETPQCDEGRERRWGPFPFPIVLIDFPMPQKTHARFPHPVNGTHIPSELRSGVGFVLLRTAGLTKTRGSILRGSFRSTNHLCGPVRSDHDCLFGLPYSQGRQGAHSRRRYSRLISGYHGLPCMRAGGGCFAQLPVEPHRQFARDGHLGHRFTAARREPTVIS
jgi:hypothetical protein